MSRLVKALCAGLALVALAILGASRLTPFETTTAATVDDATAARDMTFLRAMDPELAAKQRDLQDDDNTCSTFLTCSSQLLNLDGRTLRNPDPPFGNSCVDRCIPCPFIGFYKRFFGYSCGTCIFS